MDPSTAITRFGGAARARDLRPLVTRTALGRATAEGRVTRPFRGVFALPNTSSAVSAAVRYQGAVSHLSAARLWGCDLLRPPAADHVIVPRKSRKRISTDRIVLHYADLAPGECRGRPWPITSLVRTVLDCARTLPLVESVVIGDSVLRLGAVSFNGAYDEMTVADVRRAAATLCGPRARRARLAIALMDPRAESVLESVFRVLIHLAGFPAPRTQIRLCGGEIRVDFYWPGAHVVVEVEGYEYHSTRTAWVSDCHRHNRLVVHGYRPLRFTWDDVIYGRAYVVRTLRAALAGAGVPRVR